MLNFLWSPAFFAAQQIALALALILMLLATVLGFIATSRRQDPVAMWLLVPYAIWVGFATLLNASIMALN
jgi:tryptophan-rich sensory protein